VADAGARVRVLLLSATLLWGVNLTVLKWLTGVFDPVLLSGVRMLAALLPMLVLLRHWRCWQNPTRTQWGKLIACGVLMVYLNQWLLAEGLSRSTATNGALITALNPLMAAVLALWLLRERLTGRRLLGVLLGLAGVALVILSRPGAELAQGGLGDGLVILAVLVFTLGAVLVQRLAARLHVVVIGLCVHATGAACLLLQTLFAAGWSGAAPRLPTEWWPWAVAVLSGVLSTGIGNLAWNRAIGLVGMARAAVWLYWVPLFGVASAVTFLGEPLTPWHVMGLVLVLLGTRLGTRAAPAASPAA